MTSCTSCNWLRHLSTALGTLAIGTVLFFSCGKAADQQNARTKNNDDVEIHLTFDAYADHDVDSFRLYGGKTKSSLAYITDVDLPADFNFSAPELSLNSSTQKGVSDLLGGAACFKLTATRSDVESEDSNVVCTQL